MALKVLHRLPNGNFLVEDTATGIKLERPVSDIPFSDVLRATGASEDVINEFGPFLDETRAQLGAGLPSRGSFELPEFASFRGTAEEQVGGFFDKDFELLSKSLALRKEQATELKDIAERRLGEQEETFFNIEDVTFARALEKSQFGFAGRGTGESGVRRKAIGQQLETREEKLDFAAREFSRGREDITVDFSQFLEDLDIRFEAGELSLKRQQEQKIIRRQEQLSGEEQLRQLSERAGSEELLRQSFG